MKKAFILLSCLLLFPVLSHSQIKSGKDFLLMLHYCIKQGI